MHFFKCIKFKACRIWLVLFLGITAGIAPVHSAQNDYLPFLPLSKPPVGNTLFPTNGTAIEWSISNHNTIIPQVDYELMTVWLESTWYMGRSQSIGIQIPFYSLGGGFLDAFINDWHQMWGFENAKRDQIPFDRYRVSLVDQNGDVFLDKRKPVSGVGDIGVDWRYHWYQSDRLDSVFFSRLTFPTGDSRHLLGLGKWGGYVGLGGVYKWDTQSIYVKATYIPTIVPDYYEGLPKETSYQFEGGWHFRYRGLVFENSLIYYQSPFRNTVDSELSHSAVMYFAAIRFNKKWCLFLLEDLNTHAAADFALGVRYDGVGFDSE